MNTLCLVIVAMFVWCIIPRMGWKGSFCHCLHLQGTLSLWHFLLKVSSLRKSSQNSRIFDCETLFSKISLKYFGSGSLSGSYLVNAETTPIFSSATRLFINKAPFFDGPTVSTIYLDEIVVDGDRTYHLAVWVGKDVDYLSHVL